MKAIADQKWLSLEYHKLDASDTYLIDFYPLMVFISHSNPYVYGFNMEEKHRMLAIERIVSIEKEYDGIKPKYDKCLLKDLLSDPFGINIEVSPYEVRLLIDPYQAPYEKEKKWPKDKVSFKEQKSRQL